MKLLGVFLFVFGTLVGAWCDIGSSRNGSDDDYVLGPFDHISISVARHPEYGSHFIVPMEGVVNFPLLGAINVAGLTLAQVQRELSKRLGERLNHPELYVSLLQPRPKRVSVIGQVRAPGALELKPGWRISDAVAAAGGIAATQTGLTLPAERLITRLFRTDKPDMPVDIGAVLRDGNSPDNVLLEENDTVSIQAVKTIHVYVAGAVTTSGVYDMDESTSAVQAIAQAGGQTGAASLKRAYVIRDGEKIPVNLFAALMEGKPEADLRLKDGDTLTVPRSMTRIAVFGEVGSPGWMELPEDRDMYLSDVLAAAGGVKKSGVMSRIVLVQKKDGQNVKSLVDFHKYTKTGDMIYNPPIANNDVVIVSEGRRGSIERFLSGIVSIALVSLVKF